MAFTEEEFENFRKNELHPNDTFTFECAMCGDCCRKRCEPIILTGADIFRIAKTLGTTLRETIKKNMIGYIGDNSHVPVLALDERLDGSCRLLRKGKCMVHQNKPAVCALFPLGRYFDSRNQTFHYFMNERSCQSGRRNGKQWTLNEWLDEFSIRESEPMTLAWHKLLGGLASITFKMDKEQIKGRLLEVLLSALYLSYDLSAPYVEQVEQNMEIAKRIFEHEFHKTIIF